jgi:hypothetical protein
MYELDQIIMLLYNVRQRYTSTFQDQTAVQIINGILTIVEALNARARRGY